MLPARYDDDDEWWEREASKYTDVSQTQHNFVSKSFRLSKYKILRFFGILGDGDEGGFFFLSVCVRVRNPIIYNLQERGGGILRGEKKNNEQLFKQEKMIYNCTTYKSYCCLCNVSKVGDRSRGLPERSHYDNETCECPPWHVLIVRSLYLM